METTARGSSVSKGRFEQVGEASYFTEGGSNGQRYLLLPDGKWEPAQFVRDGGELRISRALRPLRPLVLRIKLNQ